MGLSFLTWSYLTYTLPLLASLIIAINRCSVAPTDFSDFIDSSLSCVSLSDDLDDKVSMLNSVLLSGLDTLAPLKSRSVSFVRSALWYHDALRAMKALCRKMERRWRMSGLTVHHQAWEDSLLEYKAEIVSARSIYFQVSSFICHIHGYTEIV